MKDGQPNNSSNKFEIIEMFWVDSRVRVNLEGIIVVSGIFKKAIEWIKHFMGQKEEKFPCTQLALFFY